MGGTFAVSSAGGRAAVRRSSSEHEGRTQACTVTHRHCPSMSGACVCIAYIHMHTHTHTGTCTCTRTHTHAHVRAHIRMLIMWRHAISGCAHAVVAALIRAAGKAGDGRPAIGRQQSRDMCLREFKLCGATGRGARCGRIYRRAISRYPDPSTGWLLADRRLCVGVGGETFYRCRHL